MSIQKFTFGTPEDIVPSRFCPHFQYKEGKVSFPINEISARSFSGGYLLEFPLDADEQIYGFGLQLKAFNHKNHKLVLRNNSDPVKPTGDSHAPVPFFVTTHNRGFYLDTARAAEFYCGYPKVFQKSAEGGMAGSTESLYATRQAEGATTMSIRIPVATGVDLYIIEGKNITDVVSQYNMLSGGGCTVPEWGFGTLFRAYYKYTETEILEIAEYFRSHNIPCSILGLEPGWQTKTYSCSYIPSPERFPHFADMIKKLKEMDYVNLWEHCFTHPTSPIYEDLLPYAGSFPVWSGLVPDFTNVEAQKIFADYHKRTLIDIGIDGFKGDECDGSDFTGQWSFPNTSVFPSGVDGEQMHALLGPLYCQTLLRALGDTPTFSQIRSMGALGASYPFVLYSDLYDHNDFIHGVVNQGFSGILWSPEVRSVSSKKELIRRLQTVVFSSQCLINAWCCTERYPWAIYDDCEDEVRELLSLRQSLIPMLKASFDLYHETGKPPIRALVMDYTDDPETYNLDTEYMFCENLLVAPLSFDTDTRKVYLPAGNWRDFYTKEPVQNGWFKVTTEKIPVFEKM